LGGLVLSALGVGVRELGWHWASSRRAAGIGTLSTVEIIGICMTLLGALLVVSGVLLWIIISLKKQNVRRELWEKF